MMKFVTLAALTLTTTTALASTSLENLYTVESVEIREKTLMLDGSSKTSVMTEDPQDPDKTLAAGLTGVGEIIQTGRDLVALGEEVYALVNKGRPVVNTSYAPIAVLPRDASRNVVDILDTEGWRTPISKVVNVSFKNIYGFAIATFEYRVMFAYGGTYNGKGAYINAAQIVPSQAWAFFGVTLDASMRLSGLTNHGTRENPVAGAMMQVSYKVETIMSSIQNNDSYHITGRGQITQL